MQFQIDWHKSQLELDAYVSTNHLMGHQNTGLFLPVVTFDEDNDIEGLQMPHEVDWATPENEALLILIEQRGLNLSFEKPTAAFDSLYIVALCSKVQNTIEQTLKASREQGTELGLYLVEHPFIGSPDQANSSMIDFSQISVNTVEAGVTAKGITQYLDKPIKSHDKTIDVEPSQGLER
ncbi:hypothetical protein L4D17_19910 [Vibrio splendidus]|uniref:hypothetical protein n=1 Tax=Vibrio splendidus TaxID=29497 RepID=UPI003D0B58E0